MSKSKELYAQIVTNFANFKEHGEEWKVNSNPTSAAKSRSYAKLLMRDLKAYMSTSIVEADKL